MLFFKRLLLVSCTSVSLASYGSTPATLDDIAQLQMQLNALSTQLKSLKAKNTTLTTSISSLLSDNLTLSNEVDALKVQNQKQKSEITNNQAALGQLQTALTSLDEIPIGTIVAWHKNMPGVPALDGSWVICDGQTIQDNDSPLFGLSTPDLNSDKYESGKGVYLRGGTISGLFNESTQLADNTGRYGLQADRYAPHYYGAAFFSVNDAEDFVGSNNAPNAFYSEHHRVRARFQVAAMTVTWAMKIK